MKPKTAPQTMYVKHEQDGMWTVRQERYRGRKKEHPHDVCATARSYDELREMCGKHWPDAFESPPEAA
jgi:hypothetical protein